MAGSDSHGRWFVISISLGSCGLAMIQYSAFHRVYDWVPALQRKTTTSPEVFLHEGGSDHFSANEASGGQVEATQSSVSDSISRYLVSLPQMVLYTLGPTVIKISGLSI